MGYDELCNMDVREVVQLVAAYDAYIVDAFDDQDKIDSGWVPVCFLEFIESEECSNYLAAM